MIEHSCVAAVRESAKLAKIFVCKFNKFVTINSTTVRQNLLTSFGYWVEDVIYLNFGYLCK